MSRNPKNNKSVGSAFERKVARELSEWIYNDTETLMRHPTSGATYKFLTEADIFQAKPSDIYKFDKIIEVKDGYIKNKSLIKARDQILSWYNKVYYAALKDNKISPEIWIIWKIPHNGITLSTNKELCNCKSIELYNIIDNTTRLFVYDYKQMLTYKWNTVLV